VAASAGITLHVRTARTPAPAHSARITPSKAGAATLCCWQHAAVRCTTRAAHSSIASLPSPAPAHISVPTLLHAIKHNGKQQRRASICAGQQCFRGRVAALASCHSKGGRHSACLLALIASHRMCLRLALRVSAREIGVAGGVSKMHSAHKHSPLSPAQRAVGQAGRMPPKEGRQTSVTRWCGGGCACCAYTCRPPYLCHTGCRACARFRPASHRRRGTRAASRW